LRWLQDTVALAADFPCTWKGLTYLEGLAGQYPAVVDYYIGNGRQRLENALADLTRLLSSTGGRGLDDADIAPVQAGDIHGYLTSLYSTINAYDPHYRYDFSVDSERPRIPPQTPWLVAAAQTRNSDVWTTIKIFARTREAVNERPIPIAVRLHPRPGTTDARQISDFLTYGAPMVSGGVVEADLPGGVEIPLNSTSEAPMVRVVRQPRTQDLTDIKISVLDKDDSVLAQSQIVLTEATTGVTGSGVRSIGHDPQRVFAFEFRGGFGDSSAMVRFRVSDLRGRRPADVVAGLDFLTAFRHPNRFRVEYAYGLGPVCIEPIPDVAVLSPELQRLAAATRDLSEIQNHTARQIFLPDGELTARQLADIRDAAALLSGQNVTQRWHRLTGAADLSQLTDLDARYAIEYPIAFSIDVGGTTIEIGMVDAKFVAAVIDRSTITEAHDVADFVPADDEDRVLLSPPIARVTPKSAAI
ncbi:hypothetical protein ACFROC_33365, partial [Nocardia tengchongensis]|uniref:hypothetical protein n=1 Tax=Nocardia tengchongensis TaxID=2055889 RepID=UPI0036CF31FC